MGRSYKNTSEVLKFPKRNMMKEKLYCDITKTLFYYLNNLRYADDSTLMAERKRREEELA